MTFRSVSVGVCPNMTTFDTEGHILPQGNEHSYGVLEKKKNLKLGDKTPLLLPLKQPVVKKRDCSYNVLFFFFCFFFFYIHAVTI